LALVTTGSVNRQPPPGRIATVASAHVSGAAFFTALGRVRLPEVAFRGFVAR
jgi:hypothetical protein